MRTVVLIDLPTYPKGTLSLSLPYLAAYFKARFKPVIIDLNITDGEDLLSQLERVKPVMAGLKVSSQNYHLACDFSKLIRARFPEVKIVWGGEFPTLLADRCFPYADSIVKGLFDSVAEVFIKDIEGGTLQSEYVGTNEFLPERFVTPDWNIVSQIERYNQFMGLPLETSRGCTEVCTFCMVHIMQKKHYHIKPYNILKKEINAIGGRFINIVDYNFGVNKQHVLDTCKLIEESEAIGFMAEMCLEMLDDDEILSAMQKARCKTVYCGLETIAEESLKAIHKMNTNRIDDYRRIISRARGFGIHIASGFILAIDGTNRETFKETQRFFESTGIMYAKLTFLTYNPGTKVQKYYRKKGVFKSEDPKYYDGNHLSYLPEGVNDTDVFAGTQWFIADFYSLSAILRRSRVVSGAIQKAAFMCFNICYARPYQQWIENDVFYNEAGFETLLADRYKKAFVPRLAERLLLLIWKFQARKKNIL